MLKVLFIYLFEISITLPGMAVMSLVFGIGVSAGLAGGFVVSKKYILKSMEKYLQSDECKNQIKSRVDKLLGDLVSE